MDAPAPIPVAEVIAAPPVLAYANPADAQPANGRLILEHHANGIIVTDPRSASTSPAVIRGIGAILILFGITVATAALFSTSESAEHYKHVTAALVAVFCGGFCFSRAKHQKQNPRVARVAFYRLYTTGCPGHDRLSGKLKIRRFRMSLGATDLATRQKVYSIYVNYFPGFSFTLFPALCHDEAVWILKLLEISVLKGP